MHDRYLILNYDIFGQRIDASPREIMRILTVRPTQVFLLICAVAFIVLDAFSLAGNVSVIEYLPIWLLAIAGHVLIYIALVLLLGALQNRFSLRRLYLPIMNLIAFLINSQLIMLHAQIYLEPLLASNPVVPTLRDFLQVVIFEALFFSFVFPAAIAELRKPDGGKPADPLPIQRKITIADQSFALEEVLCMRSKSHMVELVTQEGKTVLRARLADLVGQTEACDGVMAHRSYWVARHAIAHLDQSGPTDILEMTNGDKLTVARPRRQDVRNWMAVTRPELVDTTTS
ncbi:LytTR family DNA-binding domain-containing protein [Aliiroseovarius marinus]|uniref:LytTR family DNA-binding domain-containing protein n=1 Tax=Aliiroseovarius marinus TaxID=2500159 RepID=UPI003D7CB058